MPKRVRITHWPHGLHSPDLQVGSIVDVKDHDIALLEARTYVSMYKVMPDGSYECPAGQSTGCYNINAATERYVMQGYDWEEVLYDFAGNTVTPTPFPIEVGIDFSEIDQDVAVPFKFIHAPYVRTTDLNPGESVLGDRILFVRTKHVDRLLSNRDYYTYRTYQDARNEDNRIYTGSACTAQLIPIPAQPPDPRKVIAFRLLTLGPGDDFHLPRNRHKVMDRIMYLKVAYKEILDFRHSVTIYPTYQLALKGITGGFRLLNGYTFEYIPLESIPALPTPFYPIKRKLFCITEEFERCSWPLSIITNGVFLVKDEHSSSVTVQYVCDKNGKVGKEAKEFGFSSNGVEYITMTNFKFEYVNISNIKRVGRPIVIESMKRGSMDSLMEQFIGKIVHPKSGIQLQKDMGNNINLEMIDPKVDVSIQHTMIRISPSVITRFRYLRAKEIEEMVGVPTTV